MSIETRDLVKPVNSPLEINGKTKLRRKYKEEEKAARRRVMPGYPITTKFSTLEQINEYLHAEKITCLLCGKAYKGLAGHLVTHAISADEYKERFGLPYRTGLTSLATKEMCKENGSRPQQLRMLERLRTEHISIKEKRAAAVKKARTSHAKKLQARANVSKNPAPPREFDAKDAEFVISIMKQKGVPLVQAIKLGAKMEITTFRRLLREHEYLRVELDAAFLKVERLYNANPLYKNKTLVNKLRKLRATGMSFLEIGQKIGVSEMCALRTAERMGIPDPEPKPLQTHCSKGHPYNASRKCVICNTENKRIRSGHMARADAAKTIVLVSCCNCGAEAKATRLSMNRPKLCDACKKERQRAATKNSIAKNPERYKEYSRQWSLRKKEKSVVLREPGVERK